MDNTYEYLEKLVKEPKMGSCGCFDKFKTDHRCSMNMPDALHKEWCKALAKCNIDPELSGYFDYDQMYSKMSSDHKLALDFADLVHKRATKAEVWKLFGLESAPAPVAPAPVAPAPVAPAPVAPAPVAPAPVAPVTAPAPAPAPVYVPVPVPVPASAKRAAHHGTVRISRGARSAMKHMADMYQKNPKMFEMFYKQLFSGIPKTISLPPTAPNSGSAHVGLMNIDMASVDTPNGQRLSNLSPIPLAQGEKNHVSDVQSLMDEYDF